MTIQGVLITPLARIIDERGEILHMLRRDEPHFQAFGEIYFSIVRPKVVKGWHLHRSMSLNYAVPIGRIRLVLYDSRPDSTSLGEVDEIELSPDQYRLVRVPPGVWNGFLGLGASPSLVANCATEPHDPTEIVRMPPRSSEIPYDWGEISADSG